jgi:LysR family transcriptional regulator, glycine cleavage system transcriptional activator
MSQRQEGFPVDGFDFALRMSRTPVAGSGWTRLFGERLVSVCSPGYRNALADVARGIDLRRATLIDVTLASEDWQAWLDRHGIEGPGVEGAAFRCDSACVRCCHQGLSVALGRRSLVDRDLASGAPVAESAYGLESSEDVVRQPDLLGFKRWVIGEPAVFAGGG